MRYSLIVLLLFMFACQDGASSTEGNQDEIPEETNSYAAPESDSESESRSIAPETKEVSPDPLTQIKNRFQQTEEWLKNEQLSERTEEFACEYDPIQGAISQFSYNGEVVLVRVEQTAGDHLGSTTKFYLHEGEVYFVFQEIGSWRFGGQIVTDENGRESPGTVDEIEEHRFYLQNGKVFRQLEKSYTIESWKKEEPKTPSNKEVNPIEDTGWIQEEITNYLAFKNPC